MYDPLVVYFSTKSGNTKRFVDKLGLRSKQISLNKEESLIVNEPYVLITPTYGGGAITGAVPVQVIRFLNNESNRNLLKGVISTGNTNFGSGFCLAGKIIAEKCNIPNLKDVELFGTPEDVQQSVTLINNALGKSHS